MRGVDKKGLQMWYIKAIGLINFLQYEGTWREPFDFIIFGRGE